MYISTMHLQSYLDIAGILYGTSTLMIETTQPKCSVLQYCMRWSLNHFKDSSEE